MNLLYNIMQGEEKMKSLKILLATVAAMFAATAVSIETDDFVGMDTSPANAFWDVSGHPLLTNEVSSASIEETETVDTRRTGMAAAAIDCFDSRFRTFGEGDFAGMFRSDKPIGYYVIIR